MKQKHQNIETSVGIISTFAENKGLDLKVEDTGTDQGPHLVLSSSGKQVVSFHIKTVKSLTFTGMKDKIYLFEAAMFDHWDFGKYDVETQRGKDKLELFLADKLSDFNSRQNLAARVTHKPATLNP